MTEELPKGWVRTTLGEVVQPATDREIPKPDDPRPYLGMDGVQPHSGKIVGLSDASAVTSASPIVKPGYTLYGRLRPYLNKATEVTFDGLCSGEFITLPPGPAFAPRFLMYRLLCEDFCHYATSLNAGDRPRVKWDQIASFEVALPPVMEQQRIVATLDEQLSRLDAGREFLALAMNRCRRLAVDLDSRAASGTLGSGLTGGSTDPSKNHLFLAGRSSLKFSYEALDGLPHGWQWRVASDVCTHISSGATPEAKLMYADSGDVPFLKVYNITQEGLVDFTIRPTFVDESTHSGKLRRSRVLPGDVLTNIVGPPLGKTAVVPDAFPEWNINQAIVAFRAGEDILPEWLALLLRSPFIVNKLKATARATAGQFNIALSTCRDLPLPVPPLDEQRRIVDRLGELHRSTYRAGESAALLLKQSNALRRALLTAAFSGRLVPQNPDDEAASVLLDRIARERMYVTPKRRAVSRNPRGTAAKPAPAQTAPIPAGIQEELPL